MKMTKNKLTTNEYLGLSPIEKGYFKFLEELKIESRKECVCIKQRKN